MLVPRFCFTFFLFFFCSWQDKNKWFRRKPSGNETSRRKNIFFSSSWKNISFMGVMSAIKNFIHWFCLKKWWWFLSNRRFWNEIEDFTKTNFIIYSFLKQYFNSPATAQCVACSKKNKEYLFFLKLFRKAVPWCLLSCLANAGLFRNSLWVLALYCLFTTLSCFQIL